MKQNILLKICGKYPFYFHFKSCSLCLMKIYAECWSSSARLQPSVSLSQPTHTVIYKVSAGTMTQLSLPVSCQRQDLVQTKINAHQNQRHFFFHLLLFFRLLRLLSLFFYIYFFTVFFHFNLDYCLYIYLIMFLLLFLLCKF